MADNAKTLIELETRFWQALVDENHEVAIALLTEPAQMVGPHGAFQFDHATYRQMATQGPLVVTSFQLQDVNVTFPNGNTAVLTYRVSQGVAPRSDRSAAKTEDMHDSSCWVRSGDGWKCAIHTETPVASEAGR